MTDGLHDGWVITTRIDKHTVISDVRSDWCNQIVRTIANTQDRQIRDALICLGWTPPKSKRGFKDKIAILFGVDRCRKERKVSDAPYTDWAREQVARVRELEAEVGRLRGDNAVLLKGKQVIEVMAICGRLSKDIRDGESAVKWTKRVISERDDARRENSLMREELAKRLHTITELMSANAGLAEANVEARRQVEALMADRDSMFALLLKIGDSGSANFFVGQVREFLHKRADEHTTGAPDASGEIYDQDCQCGDCVKIRKALAEARKERT